MLSKTCEYAVRAMIYISQESVKDRRVNIKEIAENTGSPELFVSKILQRLTKLEWVESVQGRYGGFFIKPQLASTSLADIVRAIDGDKVFSGCGLGLENCSEDHPCPIHHEFKKARNMVFEIYQKTTLLQFMQGQNPKGLPIRIK